MTTARNWYADEATFRQLCGDAVSLARGEKAEEFAAQMVQRAKQHGLNTYLTEPQLKWLCQIADHSPPARRADGLDPGDRTGAFRND